LLEARKGGVEIVQLQRIEFHRRLNLLARAEIIELPTDGILERSEFADGDPNRLRLSHERVTIPLTHHAMEQNQHFEDYVIGQSRTTHGRTITETDFVLHAGHSGDFFPHHLDAEFARTTPFGQRIAHGTMTFTIGIGLTASVINPLAFTYGYER